MAKIVPLSFVLLWEGIWQVCGDRTIQPCGPKLCEALCESNKDCSAKLFDEIHLSCKLFVTTQDSDARNVMRRKKTSNSKKQVGPGDGFESTLPGTIAGRPQTIRPSVSCSPLSNNAAVHTEGSLGILVASNENVAWRQILQVRLDSDLVFKQNPFSMLSSDVRLLDVLPKLGKIVYYYVDKDEIEVQNLKSSESTSFYFDKKVLPILALTTDKINNKIYLMNKYNIYHLHHGAKIIASVPSGKLRPSLTIDPTTKKMFSCSSTELFVISIETKRQERVLADVESYIDITFDTVNNLLYILSDTVYMVSGLYSKHPSKKSVMALRRDTAYQIVASGNNLAVHLGGQIKYFNLTNCEEKTINVPLKINNWKMIFIP